MRRPNLKWAGLDNNSGETIRKKLQGSLNMKTSTTLKMKNAAIPRSSPLRRREEIARKAAAVGREWSAAERRRRLKLAEQLQRQLFAAIVNANAQLQSVA
jgi:hypothetical protein